MNNITRSFTYMLTFMRLQSVYIYPYMIYLQYFYEVALLEKHVDSLCHLGSLEL